ncbi:efflux RND transporter periplasmic adaptor subunit [Sebaldella sp. S0638]|uniref:efflux RND transporter periplasmic adaptor subunit n=1 Tax=Sebaldella sp. S0638 TaxID=2957809 RepID=UPI00209DAFEB|nr:efflux RND transporter periplasmic adaptor subunit [Sebaldella sp. S0638]MCP1225335.1 efflux RND transporter periplasmic adaptor subunit [Sebaldella sp. S0638]
MKKKVIILSLIIIILFTGFLIFKTVFSKNKDETVYEVVKAEKGNFELFVEEEGEVKSNNEISVYTSKALMVSKRYFELGDTVKKGELILTFDPTDKNTALRKVQEKKVTLEQKQRNYRNSSELVKVGGASKTETEDIAYEIKNLQLEIATLESDYRQYEDRIVSPVDGVISEMIADDNYRVNTDSPLFKITNIKDLSVKVDFTDYDAKNIKLGQKAIITSDALPEGETLTGVVTEIASTATKDESYNESKVEIEIKFSNLEIFLKPGNVVNVKVLYLEEVNVIKVPYTAVLDENGRFYVFVVDEKSQIVKKEVTVGSTDNNYYHIKTGISEKETLIKNADANLKNGEKVKTTTEAVKPGKEAKKNNQQGPPMM